MYVVCWLTSCVVVGYFLFVGVCRSLFDACCFGVCCLLIVVCWFEFVVCCMLVVICCCVVFVIRGLSFVVCRSLFVARCSSSVVCRPLLVVRCASCVVRWTLTCFVVVACRSWLPLCCSF